MLRKEISLKTREERDSYWISITIKNGRAETMYDSRFLTEEHGHLQIYSQGGGKWAKIR